MIEAVHANDRIHRPGLGWLMSRIGNQKVELSQIRFAYPETDVELSLCGRIDRDIVKRSQPRRYSSQGDIASLDQLLLKELRLV